MLHIISQQGNANQNRSVIPFHTHKDRYNQRTDNDSWRGCGVLGTLKTAGENVKWCSHLGKWSGCYLKIKQ